MNLQFNFEHSENNRESETFYEANLDHFNRQASLVLNHLKRGLSITQDEARELYGIRHLARRIADIRSVMEVKDERMEGGVKKYFL